MYKKMDDMKHVFDVLKITYNRDREYVRKLDLLHLFSFKTPILYEKRCNKNLHYIYFNIYLSLNSD